MPQTCAMRPSAPQHNTNTAFGFLLLKHCHSVIIVQQDIRLRAAFAHILVTHPFVVCSAWTPPCNSPGNPQLVLADVWTTMSASVPRPVCTGSAKTSRACHPACSPCSSSLLQSGVTMTGCAVSWCHQRQRWRLHPQVGAPDAPRACRRIRSLRAGISPRMRNRLLQKPRRCWSSTRITSGNTWRQTMTSWVGVASCGGAPSRTLPGGLPPLPWHTLAEHDPAYQQRRMPSNTAPA
jgi:hypothetical protein